MIQSLGESISRVFRLLVPDPFVIAVLLTLVIAALGLMLGDFGVSHPLTLAEKSTRLLDSWRGNEGVWKFLAFSMQMCLVLVTGHALATAPIVRRGLDALCGVPRTAAQGAALVGFAASFTAVINWGFGLIVGAILARDVARSLARRGRPAHAPILAAAGYTGLMVWHGGLSGSAPLAMTTLDNARKVLPPETIDKLVAAGFGEGVPLSATLFSPMNIVITLGLLAIVPVVMGLLVPRGEAAGSLAASVPDTHPTDSSSSADHALLAPHVLPSRRTPADWLDESRAVSIVLVAILIGALVRFGATTSLASIGLNEVNIIMLAAGLILHGSPRSYLAAAEDGAKGCLGIILQFPLYSGIMSMMVASGVGKLLATALVDLGGPRFLPLLTFFSACGINMFVPSGGGQWGVQGPIALESGIAAGVDPSVMIMAVAYGDQTTNMLQPFWALPLLAITGCRARDIVGYTAVVMLAAAVWISVWMVVFA